MFLELAENLLGGILSFDYGDFLIRWIEFEVKTVVKMAIWVQENVTGASLENIAYYYGYIVGLIIDIIVETLLTGGTAAVAKLMESAAAFIKNPLAKLEAGINKIVGTTKNLLDRLIDFITFISNRLKKGVDDLFTDLNKFLDEIFGFGEEVADNALSPAEKRWKDKKKAQAERLERKNKKYSPENIKGEGVCNGKILSKYDIEEWAKVLKKKYGTALKKVESFDDLKVLAQFDPNTNTILYKNDVTEYLMAHESFHAEEMHKLGFDEYVKDGHIIGTEVTIPNKIREYKREKYVYDRIIKNDKKFNINSDELRHNFFNLDFYQYHLEKRNIKIPN